jgi:hypothetical protein
MKFPNYIMLFVSFQLRNAMVDHLEGKMLKLRMKFHYDDIVSTIHIKFYIPHSLMLKPEHH